MAVLLGILLLAFFMFFAPEIFLFLTGMFALIFFFACFVAVPVILAFKVGMFILQMCGLN